MARHFFHIDGDKPHHDEFGEELRDDAAAWKEAMRRVRDIEDNLRPGQSWSLVVLNGEATVYAVTILTRQIR